MTQIFEKNFNFDKKIRFFTALAIAMAWEKAKYQRT